MVVGIAVAVGAVVALLYFVGMGDQKLSQRELDELRAAHPDAFRNFKRAVDYRTYERNGRVDFTKIVKDFKRYMGSPK